LHYIKKKLGTLSQLEWWNTGILEKWVLACYNNEDMAKSSLTEKLKMDHILFNKTQYSIFPQFQNSMMEGKLGFQGTPSIFIQL
jgi:hypothetical protein